MAVLPVEEMSLAGLTPTLGAAAAGGDSFANDGKTFLIVNNGDASPIDVTIDAKGDCDQGFDHDVVVAVAATTEIQIGPFPTRRFSGAVSVAYEAVTMVTVGAVRLPVV